MTFQMRLTAAGAAKIAAAQAGGAQVALTHMAVGDGNGAAVAAPTGNEIALVREVWRDPLASVTISQSDSSVILAEGIILSAAGGFAIREVGVFDSAGTLFAYGNFPETYKPVAAEGSSREMVIEAAIRVANSSMVTLVYDPSVVLATRSWVLAQIPASTPAGTTAQYWRGNKAWYDFNTSVRAATLSGFSTASAVAVNSGDTVLTGMGKLQAQINLRSGAGNIAFLTVSGNWQVPAGVYKLRTTLVGGGGSGGKYSAAGGPACAGGAGATVIGELNVVPGQSIFYTIGAGGARQTTAGAAGNNGGATTISGSGMTAGGGLGGAPSLNAQAAGGTPTGGTIRLPGEHGMSSYNNNAYYYSRGGATPFGYPIAQSTFVTEPGVGVGYGFGGIGTNNGFDSGAGGQGCILIEY